MVFVCHPKILHKHCFQFLLGVKMAPRETENNAYAKFWGDKQRPLWYVMVFLEGVDKTRNTEHSGTFRNIPEHEKIKIIFMKKKKNIIIIKKFCKH